ncbi:MAG: glycosyltransferase family 4 protein [Planctomycetota bacterium]
MRAVTRPAEVARRSAPDSRPWIFATDTLAFDGGGERALEQLASAMGVGRPVRVLPVFENGGDGQTAARLRAAGTPVDDTIVAFPHRLGLSLRSWPRRSFARLEEYFRAQSAAVLVVFSLRACLRLARPAWRQGLPLVVSLHQSAPFFGPPLASWKDRLARRVLKKAVARWVVLSAVARDELSGWGIPLDRIVIVPNGLDASEWTEQPRAEDVQALRQAIPCATGDLTAGILSRLDPVKNIEVAIQAIARTESSRLLIGGGASEHAKAYPADLERLARALAVDDRVGFLGHVSAPRAFLHACDLIIQPSRREASPLAVIEALACARPVIATAVGGVPELLGQGRFGWLVPPGDAEAIAAAIEAIRSDPEAAQAKALAGRRHVLRHHDRKLCEQEFERQVQSVIEAGATALI